MLRIQRSYLHFGFQFAMLQPIDLYFFGRSIKIMFFVKQICFRKWKKIARANLLFDFEQASHLIEKGYHYMC